MKNNKGLFQQIKENNDPKPSNKTFSEKLHDIFEVQFKNNQRQREIWLFENSLKQFHKALGDDGFYDMITSRPITTDTKGAEYIENFEDEYEQK